MLPTSSALVLAAGAGSAGPGLVGVSVAAAAGGSARGGDSTNSSEKAGGEERGDERGEEGGRAAEGALLCCWAVPDRSRDEDIFLLFLC